MCLVGPSSGPNEGNSVFLTMLFLQGSAKYKPVCVCAGGNQQKSRPPSGCSPAETRFGTCVPDQGDCGDGLRDAECLDQVHKIHCRVACNWKKDISDCKYKFSPWGPCDPATSTRSRSGSLKRALFNAQCQSSVTVSKPCSARGRKGRGEATPPPPHPTPV
uniref:Midkine n=1 Tax=Salarias fasciatus TaxID=181472 RepID=A0A672FBC3_SALFA